MGHHSCCNKQKVRRGLWSPEEDEKLVKYITTHGHGCWSSVPRQAGTHARRVHSLSYHTLQRCVWLFQFIASK
jgi:myb proto-oncogene protein